jgi:hypothetical protein
MQSLRACMKRGFAALKTRNPQPTFFFTVIPDWIRDPDKKQSHAKAPRRQEKY